MLPIHQRLAEIWTLKGKRELTDKEVQEYSMIMDLNAKHAWRLAKLENLSFVAYSTDDFDWLHTICAEIDKLQDEVIQHFNTIRRQFDKAS